MAYKLVIRTIECTADADPNFKFDWHYIGVIDSNVPSQKTARIMWDAIASQYIMMCTAISEMSERSLLWCLEKIQKLETDEIEEIDSSTEGYEFFLRKNGPIVFEFQYGENGPEKGGEVTLNQFKLTVQTYLQFLRDPDRKPIEVPFPE